MSSYWKNINPSNLKWILCRRSVAEHGRPGPCPTGRGRKRGGKILGSDVEVATAVPWSIPLWCVMCCDVMASYCCCVLCVWVSDIRLVYYAVTSLWIWCTDHIVFKHSFWIKFISLSRKKLQQFYNKRPILYFTTNFNLATVRKLKEITLVPGSTVSKRCNSFSIIHISTAFYSGRIPTWVQP